MNYQEGTLSVFPAGMAKGLPPGEQTTLAWLWHHKATGSGNRLPSLNTLAAECGMSKRAIITQIQSLVQKGKVVITKRQQDNGGNDVNLYDLPLGGEISSPDVVELASQGNAKWDARPYLIIWKEAYGGYFPVDKAARPLKAAEREHGREVVVNALKAYCKGTVGIYASIHSFTSKIGVWTQRPKERKYDDEIADGNKKW